jgi:hypothetical protein
VSLFSILEFAALCIMSIPLSVAFGGAIMIWTVIALLIITND